MVHASEMKDWLSSKSYFRYLPSLQYAVIHSWVLVLLCLPPLHLLSVYILYLVYLLFGVFYLTKRYRRSIWVVFFLICRERDDLMDALVSVRQSMKEMQQRESNACRQVEHAVQMAEEANFEKTKVNSSRN